MISSRRAVAARWVSSDVLDRSATGASSGSVTARFGVTMHANVEGFVIVLLPPGSPRLPNGLSAPAGTTGRGAPEVGDAVVLERGRLVAGPLEIRWDPEHPPRWDARVPRWPASQRTALGERAQVILGHDRNRGVERVAERALSRIDGLVGGDRAAREGLGSLLTAVRTADARAAARAGYQLVGRGPGLTPVGDDVLAATALTAIAVDSTTAGASSNRRAWIAALVPRGVRARTTSVSATILELAIRGRGMDPVHALLDPRRSDRRGLDADLDRIRRLGHTTGAAYAAAIGIVALLLAQVEDRANPRPKEENR